MTQLPPDPEIARARARRRLLVKNLTGLLLLLIGVAGLGVVAWMVDPIALAAMCSITAIAAGYYLATDDGSGD